METNIEHKFTCKRAVFLSHNFDSEMSQNFSYIRQIAQSRSAYSKSCRLINWVIRRNHTSKLGSYIWDTLNKKTGESNNSRNI